MRVPNPATVNLPALDVTKIPGSAEDLDLRTTRPDLEGHVQITKTARMEKNLRLAEQLLAEYVSAQSGFFATRQAELSR